VSLARKYIVPESKVKLVFTGVILGTIILQLTLVTFSSSRQSKISNRLSRILIDVPSFVSGYATTAFL
jgi:hypothetical protein